MRCLLSLLLLMAAARAATAAAAAAAPQPPATPATPPPKATTTAPSPTADAMQAAVRAYFESQSVRNCSQFASLFAPEFELIDPVGSPPVTNLTVVQQSCVGGGKAFQYLYLQPVGTAKVWASAAAVDFFVQGLSADGKCKLHFAGIDTFEFVTGASSSEALISKVVGYYNASIPQHQMQPCSGSGML
eukprot:TRINITY_DN67805_c9_g4_i1.p2 TRINITY_DN67805_c9_g4~~TRINITY_DN67805_c9_g4_i1.p2  ORF type:complete len:188 (-),score=87.97 TRINITY_DN67805_c9_g4_i1:380-943(-)